MEDKKLQELTEDKTPELADQQLEDASGGIPLFSIAAPRPSFKASVTSGLDDSAARAKAAPDKPGKRSNFF